jgi:hypothetical protein
MSNLLAAYRHTMKNRAELASSSSCGCCACMEIFAPAEVVAWTGLDMNDFNNPQAVDAATVETAVCPRCGNEALIGSSSGYEISPQFLSQMNQAWFQKTVLRKAPR